MHKFTTVLLNKAALFKKKQITSWFGIFQYVFLCWILILIHVDKWYATEKITVTGYTIQYDTSSQLAKLFVSITSVPVEKEPVGLPRQDRNKDSTAWRWFRGSDAGLLPGCGTPQWRTLYSGLQSPMLRFSQVLQQLIRQPLEITSMQPFGQDTCHLFQPIAAQTLVTGRFQWDFHRFLLGARDRICLGRQSRALQFSLSAQHNHYSVSALFCSTTAFLRTRPYHSSFSF